MKKILVITDFSDCSANASLYALKMARDFKLQIHFLHSTFAYIFTSTPRAIYQKMVQEDIDTKKKMLGDHVKQLLNKAKIEEGEVDLSLNVLHGPSVVDNVSAFVSKHKINLVVMGNHGYSALEKLIYGSTALKIIDHLKCAVLTIPQKVNYKRIQKIGLASKMEHFGDDLKAIYPFLKDFEAELDVLHIEVKGKSPADLNKYLTGQLSKLKDQVNYIHTAPGMDIPDAIENYYQTQKPDMICAINMRSKWFERIFLNKNIRQLVYHAKLPLLTIKL